MVDITRRHAQELIHHLLVVQGRAYLGALGVVRVLSAMFEDAIDDGVTDSNPFRRPRLSATDPRIQKAPREARVFSFEQMHAFAGAAGRWEPMVRVLADTGLRLGELLPLEWSDFDGEFLSIRKTAHEGRVQAGTKNDHGVANPGRVVPCPPGLAELIESVARRPQANLMFPTKTGKLWRERNFYRDVWTPTQANSGLDLRPHEMRHSYVSLLRAAGIDDADLAAVTGHSLETMLSTYTHALERSSDAIRNVIG